MNKNEFRKRALSARDRLFDDKSLKNDADTMIFKNLIDSGLLKNIQQVLCYISVRSETGTNMIVDFCLKTGIRVAVPKCGSGGKMDFYITGSRDELTQSYYGIPEPEGDPLKKVTDFKNTLCIVPGMSFDRSGKRMGYGGGFYDRFLSSHPEVTAAGICYHSLISESIPCEPHDISVDYIITEKGIIEING